VNWGWDEQGRRRRKAVVNDYILHASRMVSYAADQDGQRRTRKYCRVLLPTGSDKLELVNHLGRITRIREANRCRGQRTMSED
jgi:hypothetical protein